jgi:hypothetical protein
MDLTAGVAALDLVERVGAYLGAAAFVGLAVLALLYFSQARDVRRLREWAGRAPERATEVTAGQHYLPPTTIEEASGKRHRSVRERLRRIHIPQLRYLALGVGGLVILAGATLGALQLVGNNDPSDSGPARLHKAADANSSSKKSSRSRALNIDPSQVTVAVLNGTTIAGLAAQVGEEVKADGFTLGTVTNAARTNQMRTEVLYRNGKKDAAVVVARRLGVQSTRPVDTLTSELAGSFDAVVLVGTDRSG